jgi:quercetin dioxygenase-like cupin family protein
MNMISHSEPIATSQPEELRFLGVRTWIKADRASTGGQFSFVEQIIPPGFETPWHTHVSEDESFYVMEGRITVIVDGTCVALGAGDFAFGPRGVPHGFRVEGDSPAKVLFMASGSDFADFIAEASVPGTAPPAAPDLGLLVTVAQRHQITIHGPLPK